eukprot:TRINITY_DN14958_c0_g1_i1.p1 TRINITY_DN14958_c0_g1~~TRINITY_DN14958_c0_g1_i1.p1  ORF type:complete len:140 (-),score=29.54 TRINITY_DN14958_c0_g1_i1:176-595(-)
MACCVDADERELTFLYKVAEGACPQSYGMNVALMAGIPRGIVERAEALAAKFLDSDAMFALPSESESTSTSTLITSVAASESESVMEKEKVQVSTEEKACYDKILRILRLDPAERKNSYAELYNLWLYSKSLLPPTTPD